MSRLLKTIARTVSNADSSTAKDRYRQVMTLRLTQLMLNQRLTLSLFNFWSPTNDDGYVRFNGKYQVDDHWRLEAGPNYLYGQLKSTFFGQLENNSNVFVAEGFGF